MERNYDEVISDMLIQLDQIERRMQKADKRMEAFDKRMNMSIKRLVKGETRMEMFDKKLEQSFKDQREINQMQSKVNQYFLDFIKNNSFKA